MLWLKNLCQGAEEPPLPCQPWDTTLATHQVMAATVVHEAWVDCITVVAITSITPLADTLALQERDISIL